MTTPVLILLAQIALAIGPTVKVKPLAGPSTEGQLVALTASAAVVQTAAGEQSIPAAELMWLEFARDSASLARPTVWVELVDGSQLNAVSYQTSAGQAQLNLASGISLELPVRAVRTVRFRQQLSPALAAQWREIAGGVASGDVLVVRKSATMATPPAGEEASAETEVSLDQVEGVLLDVAAETIRFEIDSEKIDVRREKLEGIIYYRPKQPEPSPPLCVLKDIGGSSWPVRELSLTGSSLRTTSVGNVPVEWPLETIEKLDFSASNVRFLDDIDPDSGDGAAAISLEPSSLAQKFGRIFQVRTAPPFGAAFFSIGGVRYDSGLSLHSPLTLVYRVPEKFRRLKAAIGVDDSLVIPGQFELVILGDGQELFRQAFSPDHPRKPIPIDINVSGIRRVSIVLDPQGGQDIGDQLNLCEARFTK